MDIANPPTVFARHACLRSRIGGDVHVLTYTEASTTAVDALVTHLQAIHTETQYDTPRRILVDSSSVGTQPVNYKMDRLRNVLPGVNTPHATRIAVLHTNSVMMRIVRVLLSTLTHNNLHIRVFYQHERTAAIAWLQA